MRHKLLGEAERAGRVPPRRPLRGGWSWPSIAQFRPNNTGQGRGRVQGIIARHLAAKPCSPAPCCGSCLAVGLPGAPSAPPFNTGAAPGAGFAQRWRLRLERANMKARAFVALLLALVAGAQAQKFTGWGTTYTCAWVGGGGPEEAGKDMRPSPRALPKPAPGLGPPIVLGAGRGGRGSTCLVGRSCRSPRRRTPARPSLAPPPPPACRRARREELAVCGRFQRLPVRPAVALLRDLLCGAAQRAVQPRPRLRAVRGGARHRRPRHRAHRDCHHHRRVRHLLLRRPGLHVQGGERLGQLEGRAGAQGLGGCHASAQATAPRAGIRTRVPAAARRRLLLRPPTTSPATPLTASPSSGSGEPPRRMPALA